MFLKYNMDLYTETLMDVYRHPLNKTAVADCNAHYTEANPTCGDTVEVFIKFDDNGTVTDIGWTGEGCAVSQAGASLTTEYLKNKTKIEIGKITKEEVLKLLGLENINPTRMRCALLTFECLKKI